MLRFVLFVSLLASTLTAQPMLPASDADHPVTARTIFTVFTPEDRTEQTIWSLQSSGRPQTELTTHRLWDHRDSSQIILSPTAHTRLNTYLERQAARDSLVVQPGKVTVAEILDYPGALSPEQRQLVESYLAIRHGLTLDQRIPRHYLAPSEDGTRVVWDAIDGRDYRFRIAGLGVDEAARLDHRRGTSAYVPGELVMEWPAEEDLNAYLLWGDDDAPTARAVIDGDITQLGRRWRVQSTGQAPPTTLHLDPRQFFARRQAGERWVLLRPGLPALPATPGPGGTFRWEDIQWGEGTSFFRIGLQCSGCTPQPLDKQDDFFTFTQVSPNPARVGAAVDVRVAMAESSPLFLTLLDATGRVILQRRLPARTHHLSQIPLPAAGMYALQLRTLRGHRTSLKLFAQ
ncbi:hypothetical protein [Lewinella sp. W8]|uniref:hypothetical protein n=1 Tax=Lewinella sp. W8 TaxID=2528208 RepID=UPI00106857CD|nr:hypothetical protein [Lewinella sp. W8]MTB50198.1 hypothetical protein [Lewinella sp. W8]